MPLVILEFSICVVYCSSYIYNLHSFITSKSTLVTHSLGELCSGEKNYMSDSSMEPGKRLGCLLCLGILKEKLKQQQLHGHEHNKFIHCNETKFSTSSAGRTKSIPVRIYFVQCCVVCLCCHD